MLPYLGDSFGNANSLHAWGRQAAEAVDIARVRVASSIGAEDPTQIVFTSGATEGNNWVLSNFDEAVVSPFEHSSVWETARARGFDVLEAHAFDLQLPTNRRPLVSVMLVNNETGTLFDVAAYRSAGYVLHSDITQAAAKYKVDLTPIDYATFSAHKFYGPKGIGAIYMKDAPLQPLMWGGEHEGGQRAGTLNVAGIVGMGLASQIAAEQADSDHSLAEACAAALLDELRAVTDWQINGGPSRVPSILSLSFLGIQGEALVIDLDAAGFGISSGAACSSRSTEPSHVLSAAGVPSDWLRGTVRISFGRMNTEASSGALGRELTRSVRRLRELK